MAQPNTLTYRHTFNNDVMYAIVKNSPLELPIPTYTVARDNDQRGYIQ
jgi:hypothetical protein